MAERIRLLIADDHSLVRAGLRAILATEPDLALVGEATTGDAARELCSATNPDVLLLDLQMPGPPVTETVTWVRAHCPVTRVVMLTAHREDTWVRGLLERGVVGYILKDDALDAVPQAVRAVAAGGTWLSSMILPALLQPTSGTNFEMLTLRERETLGSITTGRSNKEIAQVLGVSPRTAEFHVRNVLAKLGVRSRAEAILRAREFGF